MCNKSYSLFTLPVLMTFLFSVNACSATEKIPVTWGEGFILTELLSSRVELNDIGDVSRLINEPWYSEIVVKQNSDHELVFKSCNDYFSGSTSATRTVKQYEMNAYLELKVMCEAASVILSAKPSKLSYLPEFILKENSPDLWPKQLAFKTSSSEANRSNQNPKLKYWSDVTPITSYKKNAELSYTYYHIGGYQEVGIIGRGDFNNDGIEDVVVVTRDYVSEGSYFNMRLLVLTVDSKQSWTLVKEI